MQGAVEPIERKVAGRRCLQPERAGGRRERVQGDDLVADDSLGAERDWPTYRIGDGALRQARPRRVELVWKPTSRTVRLPDQRAVRERRLARRRDQLGSAGLGVAAGRQPDRQVFDIRPLEQRGKQDRRAFRLTLTSPSTVRFSTSKPMSADKWPSGPSIRVPLRITLPWARSAGRTAWPLSFQRESTRATAAAR